MTLLWSLGSLALAGTAEAESVAQLRLDLFGQPQVPMGQYLRVHEQHRGMELQGYAGLEWVTGVGGEADLYLLQLSDEGVRGAWSLGRLVASSPVRPQVVDGALVSTQRGSLSLSAWGGMARHQGYDDLRAGLPTARAELGWAGGPLRVRSGAMVQGSLHADVEAWVLGPGQRAPSLRVLWMGGQEPVEWARLEVGARPWSRLRATAHMQHRQALDPTALFGESLTATLAPDGVDEVGGSLRWSSPTWASWSASYALLASGGLGQDSWGHAVDLGYEPGRGELPLAPAYRYRSGPGGVFHALYAVSDLDLGKRRDLRVQAGVVPYHKLHEPWDTALTASLQLHQRLGRATQREGGDVASRQDRRVDPRLTLALVVGAR